MLLHAPQHAKQVKEGEHTVAAKAEELEYVNSFDEVTARSPCLTFWKDKFQKWHEVVMIGVVADGREPSMVVRQGHKDSEDAGRSSVRCAMAYSECEHLIAACYVFSRVILLCCITVCCCMYWQVHTHSCGTTGASSACEVQGHYSWTGQVCRSTACRTASSAFVAAAAAAACSCK